VLTELTTDLIDDRSRRAADGPDSKRREEEGDRSTDQQAYEGRRDRDVDLGERVVEQRVTRDVLELWQLIADGLDEGGEQGDGGDDRRADRDTLGDRLVVLPRRRG